MQVVKNIVIWAFGFIVGGGVSTLADLPAQYSRLTDVYIHQPKLWEGTWSNNPEYVVDAIAQGLVALDENNSSKVVMELSSEEDGSITGVMHSKTLCIANPLTDIFTVTSPAQNIFEKWFFYRILNFKFLEGGDYHYIAEAKVIDLDKRKNSMKIELSGGLSEIDGKAYTLAKGLPAANEDIQEIEEFCLQEKAKFLKKYFDRIKPNEDKGHSS